jgi:hypothetical protein
MSYLPYLPPTDRTKLSPRGRELATQIEKVIRDFQKSYPDTPPGDVQQALTSLTGGPDRAPASRKVVAMTVAGGIGALVAILFSMGGPGEGGTALPADGMLWLAAGLIVVVGLVFALRQR